MLTTVGRIIYNDRIERALQEALAGEFDPTTYEFINQPMRKRDTVKVIDALVQLHGASVIALVLDAFKDLGFKYATQAGITISKNDVIIPPEKGAILAKVEGEVAEIQDQYDMGLITQEERHEAVVDKWTAATEEVADAMEKNFDRLNPILMMADSGARGTIKQIRQLAGMRGLMANPKGEIIERPIRANFMEGLTVLEYFISTHGARKGLADTALRTADSGYLTRRLVDVAQDVIIREPDCGTKEYIELKVRDEQGEPNTNLVGRFAGAEIATKRSRVIVEKGAEIDRAELADIYESFEEDAWVPVRSVLKCEAVTGVCQACYGRSMASGQTAQIGDAVGIIAAQSIGEPGTQLTMRTFHTGGVAGADITHGLPRVVELFEARKPKGLAQITEHDGVVHIEETDKALTVVIVDDDGEEHRHTFPRRTRLFVAEGEKVEAGRQLNEGSLYPHDLLKLRGRTETARYLVKEVQEVYKSQGVDINDKHIELIVRQMLKKVRVDQKGDTTYLPGQFVDRYDFARENAAHQGRRRRDRAVRGDHPRDHQGVAEHGLLPVGRVVPGDHQGPHGRRAGGQEGHPQRAEGERDHRQADPGRHGAQALPADRDRALRAAAAGDGRRRPAGLRRDRGRARPRRRRRPGRLRLRLRRGPRLAGGDRRRRRRHRLRRRARRARRAATTTTG